MGRKDTGPQPVTPRAARLAFLGALGFARDYVSVLDGAPDLERAGEWLAAEAGPDDVVACRGVAPQLPLFHGRLARPVLENRPPAEAFAELRRRGGRSVFVVAPRRRTERLLDEIGAAAGPGAWVELALRTRAAVVVRARPAAP